MSATAGSAELVVDGLTIRFGGLAAVEGMSFEVREGEVLSLIGPNGAGKTSAFNAITGYLKPAAGEVLFENRNITGKTSNEIAALGLVRTFQKTSVFGGRSVLENILIGLHLRSKQQALAILLGLPSVAREEAKLEAEAREILAFAGLGARADEPGSALPYGEQRLLGIAIALAAKPKLLLLDEPVSGMNPSETARFVQLVEKISASGVTILLVEHDMRMVMEVCDRIVVLNYGRIIAEGTPAEIQSNPEVISAYLGQRKKRA